MSRWRSALERLATACATCSPERDGYDFIRQLRATEANRATPAIALSADSLDGCRDAALAAGYDILLKKSARSRAQSFAFVHLPGAPAAPPAAGVHMRPVAHFFFTAASSPQSPPSCESV